MLNEGDVAWYEITVVENVLYIIPSSSSSLDVEKKALNFNFKKAMYRVVFLQKSVIYCLTGSKDRTQYHCFFSLHQVMKVCEPDIQKKRWSFHWPWVRPCLVPSRLSLSLSLSLDEKIAHKGSREGETSYLSPSHEPLRFVACHSRFALTSVRKSTRLRRRLGYVHCFNYDCMKDKTLTTKITRQKSVTW